MSPLPLARKTRPASPIGLERPAVCSAAWFVVVGFVAAILATACGPADRREGEREPLTATCGDPEEIRCLLPWPSSSFTRADPDTATGLRVSVERRALPGDEDPDALNRADGFSRISPVSFGFMGRPPSLEVLEDAVWLVEAPTGRVVPVHIRLNSHANENLVVLWPRQPLAPGTDHVVAIGDVVPPTRASLVALGRAEPKSREEAEVRAYHAPSRRALERAGLNPARLSRLWDFTTRSSSNVTPRLLAMLERARAAGATAEVVLDDVKFHDDSRVATVEGRLLELPRFVPPRQRWSLDDDGLPVVQDFADVRFRIVMPAGEGDYAVSLYGHGLIGSVRDIAFDAEIAELGFAKVATSLHGWNREDIVDTFLGLEQMVRGIEVAVSRLAQGIADTAALQRALAGPLGEVLAGPTLNGQPNPAAGRRPDFSALVWTGASLGGIVGALYSVLEENVRAAVLNVPGAGWTHIVPESEIFSFAADSVLGLFDSPLDSSHALSLTQGILDDVDPAVWLDALPRTPPVSLLQESIGDQVLPNQGPELLAAAYGATQVGAVLSEIPGLPASNGPLVNATGLTQFRVPETALLEVHGFAAKETPAGEAAREQIRAFYRSVLKGEPVIALPDGCVGGSCDFTRPSP